VPNSPYDLVVLGAGSAGYAAARTAAAAGLRSVVLEGAAETGGLCILRGCMPSKAILFAAEVLHQARQGKTWGLRIPKAGFDFHAVMARKSAMIEDFAGYRRQQLQQGPFDFLRAQARFTNPHTLELTAPDAKPRSLAARHFIISTGSIPAPPPCPGLEETGFMTSDDALSLRTLPRSLIVLGGGPIAVELAQFFCRMDVKVTLIQRSPHILRDSDTDAAATLENVLRREGVRIFAPTRLLRAFRQRRNKGIEFEFNNGIHWVTAQEILAATGRIPNTAGLGLDKIGVKTDGDRIITNAEMQTSVPHIYAAGDCAGPHQIVHIAVEQGEAAAHNILHPRRPRRMDDRLLIRVVFTEPQVASVGLTEKEAAARGIPFLAASYPFADHGKSLIMEAKDGFVKLLADKKTGVIIGGSCVGPVAGELIHEIVAAMAGKMTAPQLAALPHYHPTLAEIWTYPAAELAERGATCPSARCPVSRPDTPARPAPGGSVDTAWPES
jgi:pyruvate/2-oxoglutarate dehydrogenase complex dihydrolipoamide dehydrogenase (E3) component